MVLKRKVKNIIVIGNKLDEVNNNGDFISSEELLNDDAIDKASKNVLVITGNSDFELELKDGIVTKLSELQGIEHVVFDCTIGDFVIYHEVNYGSGYSCWIGHLLKFDLQTVTLADIFKIDTTFNIPELRVKYMGTVSNVPREFGIRLRVARPNDPILKSVLTEISIHLNDRIIQHRQGITSLRNIKKYYSKSKGKKHEST